MGIESSIESEYVVARISGLEGTSSLECWESIKKA
jgi:hypothetical protein